MLSGTMVCSSIGTVCCGYECDFFLGVAVESESGVVLVRGVLDCCLCGAFCVRPADDCLREDCH